MTEDEAAKYREYWSRHQADLAQYAGQRGMSGIAGMTREDRLRTAYGLVAIQEKFAEDVRGLRAKKFEDFCPPETMWRLKENIRREEARQNVWWRRGMASVARFFRWCWYGDAR